ncbi:hypothetical protein OGAPHI_003668 [Ogataea philodendri]|uniref:Uncharacterized protein n=1 Tax=Ogataea philodendri TaxID=1378263 RepID=A0A9P8P459_9ASCO|nr:uncharacterized protein OGAPHI_003668 [Ogataea philodendri]KAH3665483.1 hypothetical protein OGAPHI_003668 [Ogataea philodendri]
MEHLLEHQEGNLGSDRRTLEQQIVPYLLGQQPSNVQWLSSHHSLVHLSDGLGGLLWRAVANETESLGFSRIVKHHLGRGDGSVWLELFLQLGIVDGLVQVLDEQVEALVLIKLFLSSRFVLVLQRLESLALLLGSSNVKLLTVNLLVVKFSNSLGSVLVGLEVHKTETSGLSRLVLVKEKRADGTERSKSLLQLGLVPRKVDVLDVDVGVVGNQLAHLGLSVLFSKVVSNVNLVVVQKHTVNVLNGSLSGLGVLVVDETKTLGVSVLVSGDLTRQDLTESREGVVQSLVVDSRVEVLDENVSRTVSSERRISLGPHDSAGLALDRCVIEFFQCLFTILVTLVVNVTVAKRLFGDSVSTDSDGGNLSNRREDLEKIGFGDRRVQLTHVKGGQGFRVLGRLSG